MAEEVARLVAVVEANLKGFTKGMEQMQREADRRFGAVEKRMRASEGRLAGFGRSFRNAFLGTVSIVGIQRFVSAVGDMAGKLQDTSEALGVGTDALQTWGVLAARAGVGQDQFNKSLGVFAAKLGEAQLKGGPFAKFLTGIGVGTQGSTEEVFNRLADAIKNTSNQQQRAAIVAEAFGAKAVRLTPILQQGSAALKAQGAEFAKNGQTMSSQAIAKIDELGDKWEDLKRRLLTTGANALLPLIDEISKPEFQAGLSAFASAMSQVAVAIARMSTHLPALAGLLIGLRTAGAPGAAVGGTFGLLVEAWRRQTGQIQDSIVKLEKDLANAQARAARREPGAADQAAGIQAQINRQRAQAAGIPFAGAGPTTAKLNEGLDRTNQLLDDTAEKEKAIKTEADLRLDTLNKINQVVEDILQKDRDFRQARGEEAQERRNQSPLATNPLTGLTQEELDGIEEFWRTVGEIDDEGFQRRAEASQEAHDIVKEDIADSILFLGEAALEGGEAFERAFRQMIIQATLLAIKMNILKPLLDFALGGAPGGGFLGSLLGPGRASGGPVQAGMIYPVGERGPEWFAPNTSGTIIPNIPQAVAGSKGMTLTMVNNNSFAGAIDANSMMAYADQVGRVSASVAIQTIKKQFPSLVISAQRDHL